MLFFGFVVPKLSLSGKIVLVAMTAVTFIFSAVIQGTPWWGMRFWGGDLPEEYQSIILSTGMCSVKNSAATDDSNCLDWGSSTWNAVCSDCEDESDNYASAYGALTAALVFTIITFCTTVAYMLPLPCEIKRDDKIINYGIFQLVITFWAGLASLCYIIGLGLGGSSDITNFDNYYYEYVDGVKVYDYPNKYTLPDTGYGSAIVACIFSMLTCVVAVVPLCVCCKETSVDAEGRSTEFDVPNPMNDSSPTNEALN